MTDAPYSLADFAKFCKTLKTTAGTYMKLEPHERTIAASHFDGATEIVIVIPKKNGKTTLLAALALYHLMRTPEADCIIVASSRDQATTMFKQAWGLVRRSGLQDLFKVQPGYRRILGIGKASGMIRALASDIDTIDGEIPTLALIDELHRHRKAETYSVLRLSLGGRGGKMLTISTAGATLQSPLGQIRSQAYMLPGFRRDEKRRYNYATNEDGSFVFHEWCLSDADDPEDMRSVKLANPASWRTPGVLQMERISPGVTPWSWRRFACGIWTDVSEPWISPEKWDALATDELAEDGDCILGVRVGAGHEEAALVRLVKNEERLDIIHTIMKLEADSPLAQVEEAVRDAVIRYEPRLVAYTSTTFRRSAEILEAEGVEIIEVPYTPVRMMQVSETLLKLIEEGRLAHDGDPDLRAQVLAARTKQTERGWRFSEEQGQAPISALLALAIAADLIESEPEAPEVVFAFT